MPGQARLFIAVSIVMLLAAGCGSARLTDGPPSPTLPTITPTHSTGLPTPSTAPVTPAVTPTATGGGVLQLFDEGAGLTIATDATSGLHAAALSPATDGGPLTVFYATCASSCAQAASWSSVALMQADSGHVPTIGLTGDGRPRIAYFGALGAATEGVHYIECGSDCLSAAGWRDARLTTEPAANPVPRPRLPFAVSAQGSAAYTFADSAGTQLLYCASSCASQASWSVTQIAGLFSVPESVAFGAGQDLLVAVRQRSVDTESLTYLDCAAECTTGANWNGVSGLWQATGEIQAVIARTSAGGSRIAAYADDPSTPATDRVLLYFACDDDCRAPTSWKPPILPPVAANAAQVGYGLALDAVGNPVLAYADDTSSGISRCSGDCTTSAGLWQAAPALLSSNLDATFPITLPDGCAYGAWLHYTGPALELVGDQPLVAVSAHAKAYGGQCDLVDPNGYNFGTTLDSGSFVISVP